MSTTPFARRMMRVLTPLAVTALLLGCMKTTGSSAPVPEPISGAAGFCAVAQPILWADDDTDETIRAVKSHNAAWKRLCGGGA